jgi:ubiquinone/menaquinone biosynthesis C-methylase UbiE
LTEQTRKEKTMKMSKFEKMFVNSLGHSNQVSRHAERLLERITPKAGQSYLDVGCGNGAAPIQVATAYHLQVTGVDVDPAQIQEANNRSVGMDDIYFHTLDGTRLPFEDGQFDIVATNKVMHHIPDWQSAFAEMVRVLKPNGYLIYNDLVYPKWLAVVGKTLVGNWAGFPTKAAIEGLVEIHQLRQIHYSPAVVQYEAIFQKLSA